MNDDELYDGEIRSYLIKINNLPSGSWKHEQSIARYFFRKGYETSNKEWIPLFEKRCDELREEAKAAEQRGRQDGINDAISALWKLCRTKEGKHLWQIDENWKLIKTAIRRVGKGAQK